MAAELRPDIQAAADRLKMTYGMGRELKRLPEFLWEEETVDTVCIGSYGRGQGLLTLTDRRVLFLHLGMVGGATEETFPFNTISSVNWSTGLRTGEITISTTGNKKSNIKNVSPTDGKAITDRIRQVIAGDAPVARPSAAPAAVALPPPPPPGVPADWYSDPDNGDLLRYWDGLNWTNHTAPKPV